LKYLLINIQILIVIAIGIYSTSLMNIYWLLGEITLWLIIHIFLLRKEWKYFYQVIKSVFIIYVAILYTIALIAMFNQSQLLITLIRILNIGIITMFLLIPTVTDSFLITTRKLPIVSHFFEAFVLIRNFISGLVDDLMLGILTAQKYKNNNIFNKGKFMVLASFTLIARTPDIITNLLVSTKISKFEVSSLKEITHFTYAYHFSIVICFIFFAIQLILHYGY